MTSTIAKTTDMDYQSETASPALAQDEHNSQTSQQQSDEAVPWSEQAYEPNITSAPTDLEWDSWQPSCGKCFQIPCICMTCRWCGTKNVNQQCDCRLAVCLNLIWMAIAWLSTIPTLAKRSLKHGLAQTTDSLPLQLLKPVLWPVLAAHRQYKIYCWRKAVAAETDEPEGYIYVTRPEHIANMVTQLADLPTNKPYIGFDMEANNLGHTSELSTLQIRDYYNGTSYLVDLLLLQKSAWTTTGSDGITTLRTIFEDPARAKLIFDCRQDSACLYAKAGVKVRGALDCQYLYMLTMDSCPAVRPGLAATVYRMVHKTGRLDYDAWLDWNATKTAERSHGVWRTGPCLQSAEPMPLVMCKSCKPSTKRPMTC